MSTVSIIMPARNAEAHLAECLDSIIAQTYSDWRLTVVDDHSTDNTPAILESYSQRHPNKIRVLKNEGVGIIPALRLAYAHSAGVYVTRMDADDIMPINKLQVLKAAIGGRQGYLTTGQVRYISDSVLGEGYRKYQDWLNTLTLANDNFADIYKECPIASPNWLVHREDLDKLGAFESQVYPEDYDLCFRFLQAGLILNNSAEVTHIWRDHPDRASRTDDNYSDNRFTKIKVDWFLRLHRNQSKPLCLWGAGPKGKSIAKELNNHKVSYTWVSNNPNKHGKDIYDVKIKPTDMLATITSCQIIIAISQRGTSKEIALNLNSMDKPEVFRFC